MTVPAIIATNAIPRFLELARKAGTPETVNTSYLKSVGFNNSNDRALIPLFRSLGFLDANGKPTDIYRAYRGGSTAEAGNVLGRAIKACYANLFAVYPDAYRKDDEALTNWMRANTDKGESTQARALKTFKTLRDAASFDEDTALPGSEEAITAEGPNGSGNRDNRSNLMESFPGQNVTGPDVSINITLQMVATNDASIYDKFFASMKKHLFSNEF